MIVINIPSITYHLRGRQCVSSGVDKDGYPVVMAAYANGTLVMHPDGVPDRVAMVLGSNGKAVVGIPTSISPYGGKRAGNPRNPNMKLVLTPIAGYSVQ